MSERRGKEQWTFSDAGETASLVGEARTVRSLGIDAIGVVYQPIVDLRTGRNFAAEALVRCRLPEFKCPIALFEAAVAERACGRLGRTIREVAFAEAPPIPLFVNLHPQELSSRWLVRPDDPLNFHDQPVFLEITESAAFDHFDLVTSTLREVCSRSGAKLVVDDFGAGYSNLKRVMEIEPAVVKLDRELISGLHQNPKQRLLVTHVVELCKALGARVVAEGIETVGELRASRECGVHYGQGFLLARPGNPMPEVTWPLGAPAPPSRPSRQQPTRTLSPRPAPKSAPPRPAPKSAPPRPASRSPGFRTAPTKPQLPARRKSVRAMPENPPASSPRGGRGGR